MIVNNDEIVGTGYNGAPRGALNCCDVNMCKRQELNIPPGERYELCESVHAEQNAIISAGRSKCKDSKIYIYGWDVALEKPIQGNPCMMCNRIIKNANIDSIVTEDDGKICRKRI